MNPEEPTRPVPPVVYVPCSAVSAGELSVDTRTTRTGETALLVYSALDRLVDCCGSHQQWALLPTNRLDDIGEYVHFDLIVFDVEIPDEDRRKAA